MKSAAKWQPIETAPKDGSSIFLWISEIKSAVCAFWHDEKWGFYEIRFDEIKYIHENCKPKYWIRIIAPIEAT